MGNDGIVVLVVSVVFIAGALVFSYLVSKTATKNNQSSNQSKK